MNVLRLFSVIRVVFEVTPHFFPGEADRSCLLADLLGTVPRLEAISWATVLSRVQMNHNTQLPGYACSSSPHTRHHLTYHLKTSSLCRAAP